MKYSLVHITTDGEYLAPLVASQLFDQAEVQAVTEGKDHPQKVSAWVISSFRDVFNKKSRAKIAELGKRCAHVNISLLGGIDRLKHFPLLPMMLYKRMRLGADPVIYHCRGEAALKKVLPLKKYYPNDRFVLDVRGYWPAEALYIEGVTDPFKTDSVQAARYKQLQDQLSWSIAHANGVCSISNELIALMKQEHELSCPSWTVPCCVKQISFSDKVREEKRKELKYSDHDIVLVYSGTTAKYQHLEDMCLPLLKAVSEKSSRIKLLFLSPDKEKMSALLTQAGIIDYQLLSVPQEQVASYLSAADYGMLLRMPTIVNRVANPVKIAEYLSAGLGIIIQEQCVSTGVTEPSLSFININILTPSAYSSEVDRLGQILLNQSVRKTKEESIYRSTERYLWPQTIKIHRHQYQILLKS